APAQAGSRTCPPAFARGRLWLEQGASGMSVALGSCFRGNDDYSSSEIGSEGETAMPFYEKGDVRIHYEEVGAGFPLLVIPGGGLNSTVAGLATHPFNPFDEFKDEFRVIAADLRNAKGGQSTGPRTWTGPGTPIPTTSSA